MAIEKIISDIKDQKFNQLSLFNELKRNKNLNQELNNIGVLGQAIAAGVIVDLIDRVLVDHTNVDVIEEVASEVNEMMSERAIFVF